MVSHGNLLHNSAYTTSIWQYDSGSVMVTWLPIFHDMGLIFGILQPLYQGFPCYLMSPAAFVQRPFRWLQAISRYHATHSAAPNFAYELCVDKITEAQRVTLDLSRWQMGLNGAEPVRAETFRRFNEYFEPCGLKPTTLCHGYGLAEATLVVGGAKKSDLPTYYRIQTDAFEKHHRVIIATEDEQDAQTLIGCGYPALDAKVVIANPDTLTQCRPDEVGEIWLSSPSVAHGYWQRSVETTETFQAYLADTGEGPFLRTGDLGFLRDGELFVTGRLKDLIIIHGQNHYPQDIEATVERAVDFVRFFFWHEYDETSETAARADDASLSVLSYIREHDPSLNRTRRLIHDRLVSYLKQAEHLGVDRVDYDRSFTSLGIDFLGIATVRGELEKAFGRPLSLDAIYEFDTVNKLAAYIESAGDAGKLERIITGWLTTRIGHVADIPPDEVDTRRPFLDYGLGSATATDLLKELGEWLGKPLAATLAYDYPTIDAIARYLAGSQVPVSGPAFHKTLTDTAATAIIGMGAATGSPPPMVRPNRRLFVRPWPMPGWPLRR